MNLKKTNGIGIAVPELVAPVAANPKTGMNIQTQLKAESKKLFLIVSQHKKRKKKSSKRDGKAT
jgi:hypothetical protein